MRIVTNDLSNATGNTYQKFLPFFFLHSITIFASLCTFSNEFHSWVVLLRRGMPQHSLVQNVKWKYLNFILCINTFQMKQWLDERNIFLYAFWCSGVYDWPCQTNEWILGRDRVSDPIYSDGRAVKKTWARPQFNVCLFVCAVVRVWDDVTMSSRTDKHECKGFLKL